MHRVLGAGKSPDPGASAKFLKLLDEEQAVPACSGVMKSCWKTGDAREAVLLRLKAPDPSAQPSTPGGPLP
jgi:hypothetical protein